MGVDYVDLENALDAFCQEMWSRLDEKHAAGWTGWKTWQADRLLARANKNLLAGDYIDAANLCMMLWYQQTNLSS